jgi:hypothetical protein
MSLLAPADLRPPHVRCPGMNGPIQDAAQGLSLTHNRRRSGRWDELSGAHFSNFAPMILCNSTVGGKSS